MKNPIPSLRSNLFGSASGLKRQTLFALALSLVALPAVVRADANWTGAVDNSWDNAANWDADPAGQNTYINTLNNFPVITSTPTKQPNDFKPGAATGANGRVDLIAGTLAPAYWAFIGDWDGSAVFNIADTATTGGTYTGYGLGSGSFDSTGNGNGNFMVGLYNSTGTVNMNTTGSLKATEIRLNPNSPSGSGTFNLDAGAVNAAGSFQVGSDFWGPQTGGGAYLNMSGGSITVGFEFWTGGSGAGTTVQTGGAITNGTWFVVGRNNSSVGIYNLNGGTITKLAPGGEGSTTVLGSFGGSQGTLNVNGGSLYSGGRMYVGEGGTGTLNLTNGSVLVDNQALVLGVNSGSAGTVNLVGGTLSVGSISNNAGSGTFNFNGGTLKPTANNATFMPSLTAANVQSGGANIDTAGFDITIAKGLQGAGGLTKLGLGALTLSGVSTYTGNTVISNGTLALSGTATLASRVIIPSGKTLDVTALTVGIQNPISGVGSVNGNATGASGMNIIPATNGTVGTLTFNNNLDMSASGGATLDLSTSGTSGNDQVVVTGNLTLSSSDTISISALSGAANLDVANDYVLFAVTGTLSMASTPALQFVGTAPANSGSYVITSSGNNVVLHKIAATAPSVAASATPSTVVRNQSTKITATVTPGSGSIASVTVNLTSIGGSSSATLYLSGTPNVYTNTFAVGGSVTVGSKSLSVTVTDNTSPTALTGSTSVNLDVVVRNEVWTGIGNGNWSDNADWTTAAPGNSGDAVTFAGTTGLAPNMDSSYSVTSLTFGSTAGSFTLGTANTSTLALNGNLTNSSSGTQTLSVSVPTFTGNTIIEAGTVAIGGAAQWGGGSYGGAISVASGAAFDHASSANQTNAGALSGAGDLKKSGSGVLVMNTRNSSFTGSVKLGAGTLSANPGNQGTDGTFSYVSSITISNGATLRTALNGLFGWDGSQAKPITVQTGGVALNSQGDVNVGIINLAGGTLASTNEDTYWGSWSFGRNTTDKNLHVTENSTVTANYVGFHNGATIEVDAGKSLNYSGFINTTAADGGNAITKIGDGTLVLNGENTYAGGTTINAGTLQIGNGGTNGSIVGDVANNSSVLINRSSGTLALGIVSGYGSLTNQGGGNVTATEFYGNGPITLNGGTLSVNSQTALFNGGLTVNNNAGLTLGDNAGSYSVSGSDVTLNGTNTLTINYGTVSTTPSSALNLSGSLTHGTKTIINISGIGLAAGITVPLINVANGIANTNGFVLGSLPSGVTARLTNATANTLDVFIVNSGQNLTWKGSEDGSTFAANWNVNSSTNWLLTSDNATYAKYLQYLGNTIGDNVVFGDFGYNTDGTNRINLNTTVVPATFVVSATSPYEITGTGSIGGSGTLVKSGSGSLFLGTANTYTGGNTISGGTLIITNDNALGNSANSVTLANATLQLAGATSARSVTLTANSTLSGTTNTTSTLNGNVSGSVGLTVTGNGTLTLGGSNTIGGAITVNAANANVTGSVTAGSTLTQSGNGNMTISGPYSGAGDAVVNGGGAISLTGSAILKTPRMLVAASSGTAGTVNMAGTSLLTNNFSGGGSWWLDYAFGFGVDSGHEGTLNMSGGTVKTTGSVWVSAWGGTGHWNQTGGTANITGNFWVGGMQDNNTAQPNGSIGTAIISNATLNAGNVIVGTGGAGSGSNPTAVAASRNKGDMTVANGGVVTSTNDMQVGRSGSGSTAGGWGSYGKLNIENGGIVNVATTVVKWMTVGRYNSIDATVNVKPGGTLNLNAGTDMMINEGNNTGIRVVTVEGLLQGTAAGGSYIDMNRNGTAGGTSTLNITNGGVAALDAIVGKANCTLNFDNGTLKATASDANFIGTLITVNINAGGATLDSNGNNPTAPGKLTGAGSVTKIGNGTLILNGTNTYAGATTVNGGGIGGKGAITGTLVVNSGAGLVPSNIGAGAFTVSNNITLNSGSTNVFSVNSTTSTNDVVIAGAAVTYGGVLRIVPTGTFTAGQKFQLFSGAGATNSSNFASVEGSAGTGLGFTFTNGVLSVVTTINPNAPQVQVATGAGGKTMTLSWPTNAGWILQSNSVGLANSGAWFNYPANGAVNVTTVTITNDPTKANVFFRMLKP